MPGAIIQLCAHGADQPADADPLPHAPLACLFLLPWRRQRHAVGKVGAPVSAYGSGNYQCGFPAEGCRLRAPRQTRDPGCTARRCPVRRTAAPAFLRNPYAALREEVYFWGMWRTLPAEKTVFCVCPPALHLAEQRRRTAQDIDGIPVRHPDDVLVNGDIFAHCHLCSRRKQNLQYNSVKLSRPY